MSAARTVENRIENLEREVAAIRRQLRSEHKPSNWLSKVVGSMTKYPDFKEVVRLGREIRQADRPEDNE